MKKKLGNDVEFQITVTRLGIAEDFTNATDILVKVYQHNGNCGYVVASYERTNNVFDVYLLADNLSLGTYDCDISYKLPDTNSPTGTRSCSGSYRSIFTVVKNTEDEDDEGQGIVINVGYVKDGASAYVYIASASDTLGSNFSYPANLTQDYIAILSTTIEITPDASYFVGLWFSKIDAYRAAVIGGYTGTEEEFFSEEQNRVEAEIAREEAEALREEVKADMEELNAHQPILIEVDDRLVWHYWDLSTHAYVSSGLSGALNWRGVYVAGSTYIPLDVVSYNESTWLCITESTGNLPTTAYFVPLAKGSYQYWLEAGNTGTYEEYLLWLDSKEDKLPDTPENPDVKYLNGLRQWATIALRHNSLIDPNGDPNYLHVTTGAQTFTGVKTFSSSPIIPIPTTDFQGAPKKYADDQDALKLDKTAVKQVIGTSTTDVMSQKAVTDEIALSNVFNYRNNKISFFAYAVKELRWWANKGIWVGRRYDYWGAVSFFDKYFNKIGETTVIGGSEQQSYFCLGDYVYFCSFYNTGYPLTIKAMGLNYALTDITATLPTVDVTKPFGFAVIENVVLWIFNYSVSVLDFTNPLVPTVTATISVPNMKDYKIGATLESVVISTDLRVFVIDKTLTELFTVNYPAGHTFTSLVISPEKIPNILIATTGYIYARNNNTFYALAPVSGDNYPTFISTQGAYNHNDIMIWYNTLIRKHNIATGKNYVTFSEMFQNLVSNINYYGYGKSIYSIFESGVYMFGSVSGSSSIIINLNIK